MTTAAPVEETIEEINLDSTPICEAYRPDKCESPAEGVLTLMPCGCQALMCVPCYTELVRTHPLDSLPWHMPTHHGKRYIHEFRWRSL